ncbi:hypothetical protein MNB_SV-13-1135 [hydrothermal vent metagenome]|uniref:Lipoprotein n=1 Tax=hydrothermal vent metagenome TaxID=652676 RepID=A0A1W1CLJ0_9ZZZZ
MKTLLLSSLMAFGLIAFTGCSHGDHAKPAKCDSSKKCDTAKKCDNTKKCDATKKEKTAKKCQSGKCSSGH